MRTDVATWLPTMKRKSSEAVKIKKMKTSTESVSRKFLLRDQKTPLSMRPRIETPHHLDPRFTSPSNGPRRRRLILPNGMPEALRLPKSSKTPTHTEKRKGSQTPSAGAKLEALANCSPARESM